MWSAQKKEPKEILVTYPQINKGDKFPTWPNLRVQKGRPTYSGRPSRGEAICPGGILRFMGCNLDGEFIFPWPHDCETETDRVSQGRGSGLEGGGVRSGQDGGQESGWVGKKSDWGEGRGFHWVQNVNLYICHYTSQHQKYIAPKISLKRAVKPIRIETLSSCRTLDKDGSGVKGFECRE